MGHLCNHRSITSMYAVRDRKNSRELSFKTGNDNSNCCQNMVDCRLIVWCIKRCSTVFQSYRGGKSTYHCFLEGLLTSTPNNMLSKPLAAFPHNHRRNNGQW